MKKLFGWFRNLLERVRDEMLFWPWNTLLVFLSVLLVVLSVAAFYLHGQIERAKMQGEAAKQDLAEREVTGEPFWENYTAEVTHPTTIVPYVPTNLDWTNWDERPRWFDQVYVELQPGETLLLMCQVGDWYGQKGVLNPDGTDWWFIYGLHIDVPVYVHLAPCEGFPSHPVPSKLPEGLERYLDPPGLDDNAVG